MRFAILAFLLLLTLPSKPGTLHSGKITVDEVDVKDVYTVYNGDLLGDECNVVMFVEECLERGYNPNHLSRVIEHESMYNLTARNRKSGASGLIQFMPSTAKRLGTSTNQIRTMTFEQQLKVTMYYLDLVERDFGWINDSIDMYLAVFYPKGITLRDRHGTVFSRRGSPVYNLNVVNDQDKDGDIDVYDIGRIMEYNHSLVDTTVITREIRLVPRMQIKM